MNIIKPKKNIQNLQGYEKPCKDENCLLKLNSNENLYGPSPLVLEALKNITADDLKFYPDYDEITEKISEFAKFNPENIKVTNGADEALFAIIRTYLGKDDILLTTSPTFCMPEIYAKQTGADVVSLATKENFTFPIDEWLCYMHDERVKVLYLATPNNPTGNVISLDLITEILANAQNKIIIIDETYANFLGESYKGIIRKFKNVYIVRSFSKDFALAGLRLGYIISCEENIEIINKVLSPYSVNQLATIAGIAALKDIKHFTKIKKEIDKSKILLTKAFTSIGCKVYPSGANFLLINCNKKRNFILNLFEKHHIQIKSFENDEQLENCLRITIPPSEHIQGIVNLLKLKTALIFDMDGVLIDASSSYRKAIADTFEYFSGASVSAEKIQEIKNKGGYNNNWDLTEYLLKSVGKPIAKDNIINKFQEFYWNDESGYINNERLLIERKMLERLKNRYNLFIFTGRTKEEAEYTLKKENILEFFEDIITTSDIPEDKLKPNPFGLEQIKQSILYDKIFYFGDTIDDMKCADGADVIPIGVLPPQDKSGELRQLLYNKGAVMVINSLEELAKVVELDDDKTA